MNETKYCGVSEKKKRSYIIQLSEILNNETGFLVHLWKIRRNSFELECFRKSLVCSQLIIKASGLPRYLMFYTWVPNKRVDSAESTTDPWKCIKCVSRDKLLIIRGLQFRDLLSQRCGVFVVERPWHVFIVLIYLVSWESE